MSLLRVLIVDDEPWARRRIASLLKREADVEIVGQCADAATAIARIRELTPDLVFLDVQMPRGDGFDVLQAIGPERMPRVVFVTAYDRYALRAFDTQPIDYLLKPFDEERFRRALERARRDLRRAGDVPERVLRALLETVRPAPKYLQRLVVTARGGALFLKVADVDWFQASGNYVVVHVGREEHLLRETLTALEARLDPEQFVRIQRSTIVNLDRVRRIEPWFAGQQVLVLKDGREFRVGRAFRERLNRLLHNE